MKLIRKSWFWWAFGGCLIALSLIWAAYRFAWPGTGFQGKTLWDWLSLLIIPLVLALVALFFNQANTGTERQIADQRYKRDQEIALDKQREDLLQAYFDRMSDLLLEKGLRTSQADAEVRNVARTRTIRVLRSLDARRASIVFSFLRGAKLMDAPDPIISLEGADLFKVEWKLANLNGTNLSGVDLARADLFVAELKGTNLKGSNLFRANLGFAYLNEANLSKASLVGTDFYKANLNNADLSEADLRKANLSEADLSEANLSEANLSEVDFTKANLKGAKIDRRKLTSRQIAQAKWD